ncbi:TonB-dependent hemoglobin/transferrin/lactoferrin family receptor [Acinetobacter nectaris]|uniref:TonB-dependent hemoglobin/transferrin/lactoferrin family receptor n=1 Tax=Acinetobacter nectaris TaxID=1219382 RepID=UPI001F022B4D|nr:TonB-dependent hemoglobin/transferrin/lactoferrin family receptor [Acinetobacter nectaris]MCF9046760.1 TonB-dependent hemoglobin/transferrin/lactoferrin family receptor [Acinetobacter nectaris]
MRKLSVRKLKPNYLNCCIALVLGGVSLSVNAQESNIKLPVITVYAEQNQKIPESFAVINEQNLERMGVTNMASIIKYQPLVSAPQTAVGSGNAWDGSGTSSYNIRGVEGNRVGLDIDGVELPDAAPEPDSGKGNSFSSGRDFIDPELFSQVTIQSGTTNVSSDGIGGRVVFKTKSPQDYLKNGKKFAGEVKGGYSSADDAWFSSVATAIGNDTVKGLAIYSHRDGHATEGEGRLPTNPVNWKSDAVLAKLLWNISDYQSLGATFDFYEKQTNRYISSDLLSSLYPKGAKQNVDGQRIRYSLDHSLKTENVSLFDELNTNLFYQTTKSDNTTRAFYAGRAGNGNRIILNNYTEDNIGINLGAKKQFSLHQFNYGLNFSQQNSDRPWQQFNADGSVTTQNRMVKSKTNKYAAYISDAMQWEIAGNPLVVTPGLRYQFEQFKPENNNQVLTSAAKQAQISEKDNAYLAPSLAISYEFSPNYYSYLKYNRGNRIPTAAEMSGAYDPGRGYSIIGNSQLKKETSDAFEIGLKTTPIDGIKVDVTGFYTKYNNFIDYRMLNVPIAGDSSMTYQLQNMANANIWGGEISTRVDLAQFVSHADGFSLALVAGKTKGNATNIAGQKSSLNSVQPEKASLTFAYDDPDQRYGLGFTTTAVSDRTASKDVSTANITGTTQNYSRVPGYVVHDLSAYWKANQFMTVNVSLNNIFDKKYWDYASVGTLTSASLIDRATLPGRNIVASLAFKF